MAGWIGGNQKSAFTAWGSGLARLCPCARKATVGAFRKFSLGYVIELSWRHF
jgi:hypothetical protein